MNIKIPDETQQSIFISNNQSGDEHSYSEDKNVPTRLGDKFTNFLDDIFASDYENVIQ